MPASDQCTISVIRWVQGLTASDGTALTTGFCSDDREAEYPMRPSELKRALFSITAQDTLTVNYTRPALDGRETQSRCVPAPTAHAPQLSLRRRARPHGDALAFHAVRCRVRACREPPRRSCAQARVRRRKWRDASDFPPPSSRAVRAARRGPRRREGHSVLRAASAASCCRCVSALRAGGAASPALIERSPDSPIGMMAAYIPDDQ